MQIVDATMYAAHQSGQFLLFDLVRRHQYGSAFVLNQECYEFRWFGLAGVSPDDVNISWTFIEGLTRCQSHFLSAPHLHERLSPQAHTQTHVHCGDVWGPS